MVWLLVIAGAAVLVFKYRPRRFGDDVLKLELFRHLRYKNSADAALHMSYEDLEKRIWNKIYLSAVGVFALTYFGLVSVLKISNSLSLVVALMTGTALLLLSGRRSQTYRQIVLPLYVTLCRMQTARWDMRANASKWIRLDLSKGKCWIRLPKDWNASKPSLKLIADLVNARLDGHWLMRDDTATFLLTFTREPEPEIIVLPEPDMPITNDMIVMEKETADDEDSPW